MQSDQLLITVCDDTDFGAGTLLSNSWKAGPDCGKLLLLQLCTWNFLIVDGTNMLQSKILTAAGKLKLWYLSRSSIFSPSFQNVARKILVKWSKKVRKLESYEWRNKSGLAPHFTTSDVQHKVLSTKYYKIYAYTQKWGQNLPKTIEPFEKALPFA